MKLSLGKLVLSLVLIILGAALFGVVYGLGCNFYTLGSPNSFVGAIGVGLMLCGGALSLTFLKCTRRKYKICIGFEVVLLLLFVVGTAIYALGPFKFRHYFAVSGQKRDTQEMLISSITQIENMFIEYEKKVDTLKRTYEDYLWGVADPKAKDARPAEYAKFFSTISISDSGQIKERIEELMSLLDQKLLPVEYKQIKKGSTGVLKKARNSVEDWNWWNPISALGVVNVITQMGQQSDDWLLSLKKFSAATADSTDNTWNIFSTDSERSIRDQYPEFPYKQVSFDDTKDYFTLVGKLSISAVGIYLLCMFLMLFSYRILVKRRYPLDETVGDTWFEWGANVLKMVAGN